jgi:hypothetical protein
LAGFWETYPTRRFFVSSTLAKCVVFGVFHLFLRILYHESHSASILPVFGMRPQVGLLDEFLSKKDRNQRVEFYAKPSGYAVVVADARLNQKAFRLSLWARAFRTGLCQICLATDQADNQGSVATS